MTDRPLRMPADAGHARRVKEALIDQAEAQNADKPQYRGYWDTWDVVELARDVYDKYGDLVGRKGQPVLKNPDPEAVPGFDLIAVYLPDSLDGSNIAINPDAVTTLTRRTDRSRTTGSAEPEQTPRVHWRPARDLAPWLEHDGTINDDEYDTAGGHLAALADAGAHLTEDDPLIINVTTWDDGLHASVHDGNHRLILTLTENPDQLVPYVIEHDLDTTFPGHPYHGELDPTGRPIAFDTAPTARPQGRGRDAR